MQSNSIIFLICDTSIEISSKTDLEAITDEVENQEWNKVAGSEVENGIRC